MGRNLSPMLRRELANLDKDVNSRISAMKTLKSYVKDLDSKGIPIFLAQVSETKESGSSSGEHTISLYEVLARVHGRNIVPQIDNIMSTIVKTLMTSAGSFPLHQACSKVVPAIARYGIDPLTPDGEKEKIIYSLCKPLSDILMGSLERVMAGAALCLKALVETDNWRFASDDIVNDVCLRVAGALEEKLSQTNSHMGLAIALAKQNSLILEPYARSLIRSGLCILKTDVAVGNSQKCFSAIQMVDFLIKSVDLRSIVSELMAIVDMMEKCYSSDDQMPFVRAAAFEALQTAKIIASDKGSKFEKSLASMTGSNFSTFDCSKRNFQDPGCCQSPRFGSPESQIVDSFIRCDSSAESPLSTGQVSCNFRYRRPPNRKLWNNENCGVDVSLKDGLYSEVSSDAKCPETYFKQFGDGELSDTERGGFEGFSGFVKASARNTVTQCATPTPQKTLPRLNIDDITIFKTPRKLICSLQDSDEVNVGLSEKQTRKISSLTSPEVGWSPRRQLNENGLSQYPNQEDECKRSLRSGNEVYHESNVVDAEPETDGYESMSSTGDDPVVANGETPYEVGGIVKNAIDKAILRRQSFKKAVLSLVFGVSLILPVAFFSTMLVDNQEDYFNLVPT
ncbi:hypothetical protein AAC387_Pa07g2792 [Persea americana]